MTAHIHKMFLISPWEPPTLHGVVCVSTVYKHACIYLLCEMNQCMITADMTFYRYKFI